MKSIWFVNKCCGDAHKKIYNKTATGGQWLEAAIDSAKKYCEDTIIILFPAKFHLNKYTNSNIVYYSIPINKRYQTKKFFEQIVKEEKPDNVVIWGTEFSYSKIVFKVCPELKCYVFVQGIVDSISKYYYASIESKEFKYAISLKDILLNKTLLAMKNKYRNKAKEEKYIIEMAQDVLIDSEWAESYLKKIYKNVKVHHMPISIVKEFLYHDWSYEKTKPYTIMCPAADYPIKGLHILLKALYIVKINFPNVKLLIPGTKLRIFDCKTIETLKINGYERLIKHLVKKYDLKNNIEFIGRQTAKGMASYLETVHCFVVSSAIENQSVSFREAISVGTPTISSYVGAIPEVGINNVNCMFYRYEDYEVLAEKIMKIFKDRTLCENLHKGCKLISKELYFDDLYSRLRNIICFNQI